MRARCLIGVLLLSACGAGAPSATPLTTPTPVPATFIQHYLVLNGRAYTATATMYSHVVDQHASVLVRLMDSVEVLVNDDGGDDQ